jgi:hypothetical protein
MSASSPHEYEFTQDQNKVIGALAGRMHGVGIFLIFVAILNFVVMALVITAIYRNKLPPDYLQKVLTKASEATKADVQSQLDQLPPNTQLWGIAISTGVNGLIYLLIGAWTRGASGSFKKIVDTTGHDITHLMEAVSSLHKMYSLIYTLIVVGILLFLAATGLFFWEYFAAQ